MISAYNGSVSFGYEIMRFLFGPVSCDALGSGCTAASTGDNCYWLGGIPCLCPSAINSAFSPRSW
jgi:hypothetical protein